MRTAEFNVTCMASYHSEMEIPDSVPESDMLEYIREHLPECQIYDLQWLSDLDPIDAVTEDDIKCIREES